MKIIINAFSARRGGGQTYLLNLLRHLDDCTGMEIFVLAPNSLQLPTHPAVTRLAVNWPTDNPLLRIMWERFLLPKMLKKMDADLLFCPGGLVNTRVPKGCKTVTMFRNMIPFDKEIGRAHV